MNRKLCICVSPVPLRPIEVRLHAFLTLALDSNERSVPHSDNFIIYYVHFLMGSDSVIQLTVGAAIQLYIDDDKKPI